MTKTSGFRFWKVCSPKANSKVTDVDEERGARGKNEEGRGLRAVWERPRGPGPRGPGPRGRGAWAEGRGPRGPGPRACCRRWPGEATKSTPIARVAGFSFAFYLLPWPALLSPFFVTLTAHLFVTLTGLFFLILVNYIFVAHPSHL